jgi:hypothetical protein
MLFDIEKLAEQVARKGVTVKYYQGTMCSCVSEHDGHPDPGCDCMNGFRYEDPVETKVLRTAVNYKALPENIAAILQGGCTLTIPWKNYDPEAKTYADSDIFDLVARGDVFAVKGRRRRERAILKKGVDDRIPAFDVQRVIRVMVKGTSYAQGTDFDIDEANCQITWLGGGNAPAEGQFYTVEYECLIQYVVFMDLGMDRGSDTEILPKRFLCPLRQYVRFEANPIDSLTIQ